MAGGQFLPFLFISSLWLARLARCGPSGSVGFTFESHVFMAGPNGSLPNAQLAVDDFQDLQYTVNITLGGQNFSVVLDTGSSDLWVIADGPLSLTNDSGLGTALAFGRGAIEGPIQFAELQVGEYVVPSQAFINVNRSINLSGISGILGIAFDNNVLDATEATIKQAFGNDSTLGRTVLSNIIAQNNASSPSFDILLGRVGDLDNVSNGTFVIGQHDPRFSAVATATVLPRATTARWSAFIDGLSVNGQNFTFNLTSRAGNAPGGKLVGFLDTGTSLPMVPAEVAQMIYGSVPGAVNDNNTWFVPCHTGANLTWFLGGQAYPTHPLDLTLLSNLTVPFTPTLNITSTMCIGAYQVATPPYDGIDIVLGDSFLRNVYASFNFGPTPFPADHNQTGSGSFIQLLSTTDPDAAWAEFVTTRYDVLAQSPFVLDPLVAAQFPGVLDMITMAIAGAGNQTAQSQSNTTSTASENGASAGALAARGYWDGDIGGVSTLRKTAGRDPVVVGLLGGNILLVACLIGVVAWTRRSPVDMRTNGDGYLTLRTK